MSVPFRTRNRLLLLKVEATPGTDAVPTPAANAVRTSVPTWSPALEALDSNYAQESIDAADPITGGGSSSMRGQSKLTGAGTAGTAPDWGVIMRGGAMAELLTAADVTGTAQAGTASSITLAAGASAVNDAYKGMPIELTGGTGGPSLIPRAIIAYNGTTKVAMVTPNWTVTPDATSLYAIRKNARYVPVTQGQENLSAYLYNHGSAAGSQSKLAKSLGAMMAWQIALQTGKLVDLNWTLMGILPGAPTDVAKPSAPTFTGADPEAFKAAQCYLNGVAVKLNSFGFDCGNGVAQFDDPAATHGKDTADITTRTQTGRLALAAAYTSTYDAVGDFIASTSRVLWLNWGSAVGKRVSLLMPAIRHTGPEDIDIQGYSGQGLPFRACGFDTGIYVSVW